LELAKADELGFNALIKPINTEVNKVDNEKESNNDGSLDNKSDNLIDNKIDTQPDILKDIDKSTKKVDKVSEKQTNRKENKRNNQDDIKKGILKETPLPESPMAALIASKKKGVVKKFVGLHLPSDVDDVLTQFKKDTDIDKSEAVTEAVKLFLKDYFE